ncbi:hypothetical protein X848_gp37 [Edwardsiella phage PEi21]|uniref:Uncharacterized protein n=1 Tax=Edwardsiella phage PEi21 TaxID=1325372 RepID=N0DU98_9CAUD|nr:hypothetical protein X848_gp37 [Edwardsiella phage PEi21]BAN16847.1 hypothetical protein [Edwardsiella phage PEi21]
MNYEQMSDQQITDEIIKRRGLDTEWHRWDFCNSWADMGPLIVENGIVVIPYGRNSLWMAARAGVRYHHTKPLRAAAIVYLMMTEAGK